MTETVSAFQSFVGVDLHKCTLTLSAVDANGKPFARLKTSTKCVGKIDQFLRELPGPVWLAVEACPFVEWFIDRYRPIIENNAGRFDIADATELANRRGKRRKTDINDARDIATRLWRGDCPLGWIADDDVSMLRKLGRQWHRLSRMLGRTKASIRSLLLQQNLPGPGKLTGASGQKWLLSRGHALKPVDRENFRQLISIVQCIEVQMSSLKLEIMHVNRSERFVGLVELLQTVPGIGEIFGCIIAAEIGDFTRFPNADALEFWAGLTPDVEESAGRRTTGNITKAGSRTLRWALCKAGQCMCRSDGVQERVRQRILSGCGHKAKANVAMGRRLLRILFAMVKNGEVYRMGEPTSHTLKANRTRMQQKRSA